MNAIIKEIEVRRNRILPPTVLFLAIGVMVGLHFLIPVAEIIPAPWNYLGILLFVVGTWLNLVADRAFKNFATTVKPFEESSILVTDGVYRICRHPMYLGFVLILSGIAVFMGSLTPFVVVPIFAFLIDRVYIRVEESMLAERFGTSWTQYRRDVRRWI
jgi:protein-S-isoprenylcysteine O-methyltransferase Ste14